MTKTSTSEPRVEAGEFLWDELLEEQRDAIIGAAKLMRGMRDAAWRDDDRPTPKYGPSTPEPLVEIRRPRSSNVILFDGQRGMGKTSAALTLLRYLQDPSRAPENPIDQKGKPKWDEAVAPPKAEELHGFLPIGIIDARPLPDDAPPELWLIRPFLTLADKLTANEERQFSLSREEASDLGSLRDRVVRTVAGGWAGRGPADARGVEECAADVEERDRLRSSMSGTWRAFVDELRARAARSAWFDGHGKRPVFVLLVDDVDMNFQHTTAMLELMRLLAHRGVVFALTGYSPQMRDTIHIETLSEVLAPLRSLDVWSDDSLLELELIQRVGPLSRQLLRKLVPITHRMMMRQLSAPQWRKLVSANSTRHRTPDYLHDFARTMLRFPGAFSQLDAPTVRSNADLRRILLASHALATDVWLRSHLRIAPKLEATSLKSLPIRIKSDTRALGSIAHVASSRSKATPMLYVLAEDALLSTPARLASILISRASAGLLASETKVLHSRPATYSFAYTVVATSATRPAAPIPWPMPRFEDLGAFLNAYELYRTVRDAAEKSPLTWEVVLTCYVTVLARLANSGTDLRRSPASGRQTSEANDETTEYRADLPMATGLGADAITSLCWLLCTTSARFADAGRCAAELVTTFGLLPESALSLVRSTLMSESIDKQAKASSIIRSAETRLRPSTNTMVVDWSHDHESGWSRLLDRVRWVAAGDMQLSAKTILSFFGVSEAQLGGPELAQKFLEFFEHFDDHQPELGQLLQAFTSLHGDTPPRVAAGDTSVTLEPGSSSAKRILLFEDNRLVDAADLSVRKQVWRRTRTEDEPQTFDWVAVGAISRLTPSTKPARLHAVSAAVLVGEQYSTDSVLRYLVAADVLRVSQLDSPARRRPSTSLPFAVRAFGLSRTVPFCVEFRAPLMRTHAQWVSMCKAVSSFVSAGRGSTMEASRVLAYLFSIVRTAHEFRSSTEAEELDRSHHADLYEAARACIRDDLQASAPSSLTHWLSSEVPLWLAPEYGLPTAAALKLMRALYDSGIVNWQEVILVRDARLEELRENAYGSSPPAKSTVENWIRRAESACGCWAEVKRLTESNPNTGA